jgi:hypothetical protein
LSRVEFVATVSYLKLVMAGCLVLFVVPGGGTVHAAGLQELGHA